MITRPKEINVPQLDPILRDYIVKLEDFCYKIANDSIGNLYLALKSQIDEIAIILDEARITDLSDKEDKVFDRIIKLSTDSRKIVENMKYLESQMNPEKEAPVADAGSVEGIVKGIKDRKNARTKV